jgi:hypothetical protein
MSYLLAFFALLGLGLAIGWVVKRVRSGESFFIGKREDDGGAEIRKMIGRYRTAEERMIEAGKKLATRRAELDVRIDELRMERGGEHLVPHYRVEREENIRTAEQMRRHLDRMFQRRMVLQGYLPLVISQRRIPHHSTLPMAPPERPEPGKDPGEIGSGPALAEKMGESAALFAKLAEQTEWEAKTLSNENPKDDTVAVNAESAVRGAQADRKAQVDHLYRLATRLKKLGSRFEAASEVAGRGEKVFDAFFRGAPDQIETERLEAEDRILDAEQIGEDDLRVANELMLAATTSKPPPMVPPAGGAKKK